MKTKSAVLGAVGALVIGGAAFGLGVTAGVGFSSTPTTSTQAAAVEPPPIAGWRADAWETYTVGIEDMADTRDGFDKTYLGTYSTKPGESANRVILESVRHPGTFHVFSVDEGSTAVSPAPSA